MTWERRPEPWPHWVHDSFLTVESAALITTEALSHWWSARSEWVGYRNDVEQKWALASPARCGPATADLFAALTGPAVTNSLAALTGVRGLVADGTLHGGGIHVVAPGGHLAPHVDYSLHPKLPGMERRVNLILFLSGDPDAGGAFELWDDECRTVVSRVAPSPGRAVVWCPGDVEYHGTQAVTGTAPRVAAAVYYLAPARPTSVRKVALFRPYRGAL